MGVLERRLRRLEVTLLPAARTESSRLYHDAMLAIIRNRARRRGLPEPDSVPGLEWTHNMTSLAEIIRASRQRFRERQAAEATGAGP